MNLTFQNTGDAQKLCITDCGAECGKKHTSESSKVSSLWDWTGSMGTSSNPKSIGVPMMYGSNSDWWNVDDSCFKDPITNLWSCPWSFPYWNIKNPNYQGSRTIVWINVSLPGLINDVCDATRYPECNTVNPNQYAPYTTYKMCQWGKNISPPQNTSCITLGPWANGISGISSIGWYMRVQADGYGVNGAPSFLQWNAYQMAIGSWFVLAIAYPPSANFTVSLLAQYSSFSQNIPMALSAADVLSTDGEELFPPDKFTCPNSNVNGFQNYLCTNTNRVGKGFGWYFDGKFLYLRFVPIEAYRTYGRYAMLNKYTQNGLNDVRVWTLTNTKLQITASCNGCPVQSSYAGVTYWDVPDEPPANFLDGTTLHPTLQPTNLPTMQPTLSPSSALPTVKPSAATAQPTLLGTPSPITPTILPSKKPTTASPSLMALAIKEENRRRFLGAVGSNASANGQPTSAPSANTRPSCSPTRAPTCSPTMSPTLLPTSGPTKSPTLTPTTRPSPNPTSAPSFSLNKWNTLLPSKPYQTLAMSRDGKIVYANAQSSSQLIKSWVNSGSVTMSGFINGSSVAPWSRACTSSTGQIVYLAIWGKGIAVSSNYGMVFNDTSLVQRRRYSGIACSGNGDRAYAISYGDSDNVFASTDYGSTWVTLQAPSKQGKWQSISSSSDGKHVTLAEYGGYLYTSHDYAQTFTVASGAPWTQWQSVSSSDVGTLVAAAVETKSGIWISNDFGSTWTRSASAPKTPIWRSVAISSDGSFMAACSAGVGNFFSTPMKAMGGIYFSTDSGKTWFFSTKDVGSANSGPFWMDLAISSDGSTLVAGAYPSNVFIYKRVPTAVVLSPTLAPTTASLPQTAPPSPPPRIPPIYNTVIIVATTNLYNISAETLSSSSSFETAFIASLQSIFSNYSIPLANVIIKRIYAISIPSLASSRLLISSSSSVGGASIEYEISALLQQTPYPSANALSTSMTSVLNQACVQGILMNELKAKDGQDCSAMLSASLVGVFVYDSSPTIKPTTSFNSGNSGSGRDIQKSFLTTQMLSIIICTCVGVSCLLAIAGYLYFRHQRNKNVAVNSWYGASVNHHSADGEGIDMIVTQNDIHSSSTQKRNDTDYAVYNRRSSRFEESNSKFKL